jgi:hypothetical protein
VNDWTLALNSKHSVDCFYIDFAKAFDSVVHSKLCAKLVYSGISGRLLSWLTAFLSNRTQQVKVGGKLSGIVDVISGVPQGSVLGPLLFLIFINDLVDVFDSKLSVKLFADDVKVYVVLDESVSSGLLQSGLDKLSVWANDWQLQISIPKCSVLHIGNNSNVPVYNINGNVLPDVTAMRDLGVTVDSDLRFKLHISNIVAKAHQRACLILRCFKSRVNANTLFRAFIVYVRPLLEYCASVWSPCYISDILKIESVQRRFSKRLISMRFRSYCDRLHSLDTDSLQVRRLKADLTMMFKIVNDLVDVNNMFVPSSFDFNLRRHNKYLLKPIANCNCRAFSFACRHINVWNSLPSSVVNCNTVSSFKRKLDLLDFDSYLPVAFN